MPDKFTALTPELHRHLVEHGSREDDLLHRLREETAELGDVAVMQIAPEQGALLTVLARAIGARAAIEVGTFTGYSAICTARGLPADGRLLTIDVNQDWTEIAFRYFQEAELDDRIEQRIGRAVDILAGLPADEQFDLAFVDADKPAYPTYYEECLARLRVGGLLLLDNVLLGGRVLDPGAEDGSARAIRALTERISADERIDLAIVGVADGLAIARKR